MTSRCRKLVSNMMRSWRLSMSISSYTTPYSRLCLKTFRGRLLRMRSLAASTLQSIASTNSPGSKGASGFCSWQIDSTMRLSAGPGSEGAVKPPPSAGAAVFFPSMKWTCDQPIAANDWPIYAPDSECATTTARRRGLRASALGWSRHAHSECWAGAKLP